MKIRRYQEKLFQIIVKSSVLFILVLLLFIIGYIFKESMPAFKAVSFAGIILEESWRPLAFPPALGVRNMLLASGCVASLAVLIALPVGLGMALWLNTPALKKIKRYVNPFIDLLAGVPSVVYGFFALFVIVKFIENNFTISSGESILAAGIILALMVLPYIVSTCDESIEKILASYEESSRVLGISFWYMIVHLVLPSIQASIYAAFVLAFSRGIGETMAVIMVVGNSPLWPSLLGKGEPIPALIALEMGSAQVGSLHYHGLFAAGILLLGIILVVNLLFYLFHRRYWAKKF